MRQENMVHREMATDHTAASRTQSKPLRRLAWVLLSYAIAGACLFWVFHGLPVRQVVASWARINWWWVAMAVLLDVLVYLVAAWEWQLLLRPAGHLPLGRTLQALFAGRFANDFLPVHAGYIIRIYLASRWIRQPIASVLPSLLIERFFDTLWLVLCIGTTLAFFHLPGSVVRTGEILGGVILLGGIAAAWILRRNRSLGAKLQRLLPNWGPIRKVPAFLRNLAQGLRRIAHSFLLPAAVGLSLLKLAIQALSFLLLLWSYGFGFPLWANLAIFLIAYVGISVPSTPSSIGVFQIFCVTGLRFFGTAKPVASGFALVAFVILTVPLTLGGCIAFAQTGLSWRQLRTQVGEWKQNER